MSRKLEELLDIPHLEDIQAAEEERELEKSKEKILAESADVLNALTSSEKIEHALTTVTGLLEHDNEMDEIALKALKSYKELIILGMNAPPIHSGKLFEVASTMLKTALDAKDAKVNKKLKMIDLQMKKYRIDALANNAENNDDNNKPEFDRNELLQHIKDQNEGNQDK